MKWNNERSTDISESKLEGRNEFSGKDISVTLWLMAIEQIMKGNSEKLCYTNAKLVKDNYKVFLNFTTQVILITLLFKFWWSFMTFSDIFGYTVGIY